MRKQREEEYLSGNLTAMIDVVFQLIIFFVATTNMQDKAIDDRIKLAMAPHGAEVKTKNPLEITIDVDTRGSISIARTPYTIGLLEAVLKKAYADAGGQIPVIIRADANTKHEAVQRVMDACLRARIWRIKFAALKEKGS